MEHSSSLHTWLMRSVFVGQKKGVETWDKATKNAEHEMGSRLLNYSNSIIMQPHLNLISCSFNATAKSS